MTDLKIARKGKYISEAFGWKQKDFEKLLEAMQGFMKAKIVAALDNDKIKDDDLPDKTSLLSDFLTSKEFSKLKLKFASANDYFVLGYAFHDAQKSINAVLKRKALAHILGHVIEEL